MAIDNFFKIYTYEKINLNNFSNFISLGYFCSVARDLEKIGLRDFSSPFDWILSDFKSVISLINNNFMNFMNYENLAQSKNDRTHYLDLKNKIFFFHDFSKYKSLEKQYDCVYEKYNRRIIRFYKEIKKPTLFIRYISNEIKDENGKSTELNYIEENYKSIIATLKKFNKNNELFFIADNEVISEKIKIFHVDLDIDDVVCRSPIVKNDELYNLLNNVEHINKRKNINRYKRKEFNRKIILFKGYKKILKTLKKRFLKEYIHNKTYFIPNK